MFNHCVRHLMCQHNAQLIGHVRHGVEEASQNEYRAGGQDHGVCFWAIDDEDLKKSL